MLILDERKEGVPPEFQVIFICFLFVFDLFFSAVDFFSNTRNPFRIVLYCYCTTRVSLLSISSTHTHYCNISKDFTLTIIFLDSFVQCKGSHVAR